MEQSLKELLLKDLCARLPYHPIVYVNENLPRLKLGVATRVWEYIAVDKPCKPYLRPMSNMTEKEKRELQSFYPGSFGGQWLDTEKGTIDISECSSTITLYLNDSERIVDWLNAHHFDYRGLIDRNLALEASEGMYNN